jgi:hypothetical protein
VRYEGDWLTDDWNRMAELSLRGGVEPLLTALATEPPKVLGPPTDVLVLRTSDNPVDAHNH